MLYAQLGPIKERINNSFLSHFIENNCLSVCIITLSAKGSIATFALLS